MIQNAATKPIRDISPNGHHAQFPLQNSLPFWRRAINRISPSKWEHVTVNNKIDSVTMPKWIAAAILGAVLTFGVGSWWRASNEHDTLIEIRTELRLSKEAQTEKDRIINGKLNDMDAWKTIVSKDQREIIGMLKQQQIDALARPGVRQIPSNQ